MYSYCVTFTINLNLDDWEEFSSQYHAQVMFARKSFILPFILIESNIEQN